MVFYSDYFQHRSDWYSSSTPGRQDKTRLTSPSKRKQAEREQRIATLAPVYREPLNTADRDILAKPIAELVQDVQKQVTSPLSILHAYGKVALRAHEATNCLTEVMLSQAEIWTLNDINLKGSLAGIPISLKDTLNVKGFDSSVGYSSNTFQPVPVDGIVVQLLKEAGAVPFVKTNIPTSLLSFESTNDVWGRTTNPHNSKYSPGGSTGGESALLAFGGSRIGIGSDVAGSVRAPAHFSGCYSIRCSTGRWPKLGAKTSMPGQEGILAVFSPMARTLDDLTYFTRAFVKTEPWRLDHSVHPLAWRDSEETAILEKKRLRIGVMRTDHVIDPAPACARALETAAAALRADGHEVFDVEPPSPYEALRIASILLNADGCRTFSSFQRSGEWMDAGAVMMQVYMRLPRWVKWLHASWVRHVRGDAVWAGLLESWSEKSAFEQWQLVAKRELYKARWHEWWNAQDGMDFILTPPNATPAVPHNGMKDAVSSCGYTFLFNLVSFFFTLASS